MPWKSHKSKLWGLTSCVLLMAVLLSACGAGNATPTVSVDAVYTAAYQTLLAQQATQLALTPPTSTVTPTPPPTLLPPPTSAIPTLAFGSPTSGVPVGGGACDSLAFVSDVTYPDNTVVDPGKKFTKTWRVMNNGTCTWSTSYIWTFDSGDQMSGANTPLSASVPPGATVDISVNLVAPTTAGTYKGVWSLHNASGQALGFVKPYVIIKVGTGGGPSATAGPSPTASVTPTGHSGILIIISVTRSDGRPVDFEVSISAATTTPDCAWNADNTVCSLSVPKGWSGTISLSKGTYKIDPSSKTFKDVQSDQYYNATAS